MFLIYIVLTFGAIWLVTGAILCWRNGSFWSPYIDGSNPIKYWLLGPFWLPAFHIFGPLLTALEEFGGPKRWDIFLSYSHWNCLWASAIYGITRYSGAKVFLDFVVINRGADWRGRAEKGISESDIFVYLDSPDARGSENVQYEVRYRERTYRLTTERWRQKKVNGSEFPSDAVKSSSAFNRDIGVATLPILQSPHPDWKYQTPRREASEAIGNMEGWLEINLPAVELLANLLHLPLPPRSELDTLMRQYLEFAVSGDLPRFNFPY